MVNLAWCTVGIYYSITSAFLKPHCHKASNHLIISELMHHFTCNTLHKQVDLWDADHLLSLLESWAPASSLTNFELA